ncbi:TIGR01244 family sulfur transferase, partial [Paracoccus aurantiacus]
ISPKATVSPQIAAMDMAAIKAAGYRAIICNRPDGEGADQPSFEEIEAAAKAEGIETRYVPVESGMVTDQDVAAFGQALAEVQRPVLAYCRTGTRSA